MEAAHKSTSTYRIRPMVTSDLPQVVQLEHDIFPDPWSRRSFAESLIETQVESWVVEIQNRIIGYMIALWVSDETHILNLAVEVEYRRRGIATQMLTALEDFASRQGCSHFWLEVRSSNVAAQKFYDKHGFKPLGHRKHYYRNGEDALIMAKIVGDITE